jgi:hypothetical protein
MASHDPFRALDRRPTLAYVIVVMFALACGPRAFADASKKEIKSMSHANLAKLIEALARATPFKKEKVEQILGVTLEPDQEDQSGVRYRARTIGANAYGVPVAAVDLRLRKDVPAGPGFLVVNLGSPGISRAEVESQFPGGKVELPRPGPPPEGVSPDNHIGYVVQQAWGELTFGFRVGAPKVLDIVALEPRAR